MKKRKKKTKTKHTQQNIQADLTNLKTYLTNAVLKKTSNAIS